LKGDTIVDSSWTIDPAGALTNASESFTTTGTVIWLTGGNRGRFYKVINHVTTAGGREDDRTILVEMKNK